MTERTKIGKERRNKGEVFEGEPCKKCGSRIRYIKGTHCVRCKLTRGKAATHWKHKDAAFLKEYRRQYSRSLEAREYSKEYWKLPEVRDRYLRRVYGITLLEYNRLLFLQNKRCAICTDLLVKPFVDHNHTTGKVRGLLCTKCNSAIGYFKDNPNFCKNAATYLETNG